MAVDIVVDGLPWSGKRTLGRKLAEHYKMLFLNSGDAYRVVGLLSDGNIKRALLVAKTLQTIDLSIPELRDERAARLAYIVAQLPEVRATVNAWIREKTSGTRSFVLGGQNGAREFPEAIVRLFLAARADERLKRYLKDLALRGMPLNTEEARESLFKRERVDMARTIFPVQYDPDVYHVRIDTTELNEDETFNQARSVCELQHELARQAVSN